MSENKKVLLREYFALCPDGMCNVSVLNESELKLKNEGYTILSGIIQSANKKNGNGRIYRREILEREDNNYQRQIRNRSSCGVLDHPFDDDAGSVVELKNASHMVLRTWWEGDDLWGTLKVLKSTPSGQTLEGLIKDGVRIGISSRALGSVRETSDGLVVEDDMLLICYDAVSDPSVEKAYMRVQECKNINIKNILTKADRINRCLNEICKKR